MDSSYLNYSSEYFIYYLMTDCGCAGCVQLCALCHFYYFFVVNGQFLIFFFAFFSFSVCAMTDFHDKKFFGALNITGVKLVLSLVVVVVCGSK